MVHQQLGVDLARVVEEAEVVERHAQPLGVVVEDRLERRDLELDLVAVELLGHAEVEERHAPVRQQQVVAGVGVGVEVLQVVDRAEAEAEDDLAEAVALRLRQRAHLLEAGAVHPLAHQHALGGQPRDHVRARG